uniref:Vesicle transport protein n=1 Tax=Sinocyclocheilus anshuiensis TaxID=1608454 RepID=A0A671SQ15_9TELE
MDKLRAVLSGRDGNNDNRNVLQAANEASTLGWGTRVKGFLICMVIGVVCTILGVCCLFIPKIGVIIFIVFYTFGNICSLVSTMFLMGPLKQLKRMCDKTRAFATVVMLMVQYYWMLFLTLISVPQWKIFALTLLFVILQVLAFADAILKFFAMLFTMCVK